MRNNYRKRITELGKTVEKILREAIEKGDTVWDAGSLVTVVKQSPKVTEELKDKISRRIASVCCTMERVAKSYPNAAVINSKLGYQFTINYNKN